MGPVGQIYYISCFLLLFLISFRQRRAAPRCDEDDAVVVPRGDGERAVRAEVDGARRTARPDPPGAELALAPAAKGQRAPVARHEERVRRPAGPACDRAVAGCGILILRIRIY
jgi:hypothetical protein